MQILNLRLNTFSALIIYNAQLNNNNSLLDEFKSKLNQLLRLLERQLFVKIRFNNDEHNCHVIVRFIYTARTVSIYTVTRLSFLTF